MPDRIFTINSHKADNKIHRTWQAECLAETDDYWLFVGEFSETVKHKQIGIIRQGTVSYEYYWKKRWYNVFRFHEPGGELRNFYCNVSQPPLVSGMVLDYVDLDVDVLVWKDFSCEVLDIDEFEVNSKRFGYSDEIYLNVEKSLDELLSLIENRRFPFDFVEVET
ncbi:MAG: DUF402 domain-containing protein [Pyrinomonadaceae bacterium]